ncbi:glycosyltransferase [Dialister sp.]|uniref:glycosyltransferase n=1 Tax=Dialister sp. TaxID=1955814 RepID=UPI002E821AAA|nr:glycosyltransferase [Dialister sp.]MEE3453182.1 glycosyltransferase [Dialister sp.]
MKKILFYNWVPFDETERKGGGVTVYTRNLIEELCQRKDVELFFLSSGRAYDLLHTDVRIESTDNIFGRRVHSFQIVNSPVFSSALISFPFVEIYLNDGLLLPLLKSFLEEKGPFDVVHFQNWEGLSAACFQLKQFFPGTKFIYSLHNYYPFCPHVNLWKAAENCSCRGDCGEACISCMPKDVFADKVRINQYVNYLKAGKREVPEKLLAFQKSAGEYYSEAGGFQDKFRDPELAEKYGRLFKRFADVNIAGLNNGMDYVLAVSERVKKIAHFHGLKAEKTFVSYIGHAMAEHRQKPKSIDLSHPLHIAYLGYMTEPKGFYFLLSALESMSDNMARKLEVTIAAPGKDAAALERVESIRQRFAAIHYYDGYTKEKLPGILKTVDLGLVPVLWEDNLPQVAIEMKLSGIPVLSSDMGGAQELSGDPAFVFQAGNREDFLQHLLYLQKNRAKLLDYWKGGVVTPTMGEHIDELYRYYGWNEEGNQV